MAVYYTIVTLLILSGVMTFLTGLLHVDCIVKQISKAIIRKQSANLLLIVAQLRLLAPISFLLVLIILLFYIYLFASLPVPIEGTIEGALQESGNITGKIVITRGLSLERIFLGFIFVVAAGVIVSTFGRKLGSLKDDSYEHTYNKLLPHINRIVFAGNTRLSAQITKREQSIVVYKEENAIKDILTKMRATLENRRKRKGP